MQACGLKHIRNNCFLSPYRYLAEAVTALSCFTPLFRKHGKPVLAQLHNDLLELQQQNRAPDGEHMTRILRTIPMSLRAWLEAGDCAMVDWWMHGVVDGSNALYSCMLALIKWWNVFIAYGFLIGDITYNAEPTNTLHNQMNWATYITYTIS